MEPEPQSIAYKPRLPRDVAGFLSHQVTDSGQGQTSTKCFGRKAAKSPGLDQPFNKLSFEEVAVGSSDPLSAVISNPKKLMITELGEPGALPVENKKLRKTVTPPVPVVVPTRQQALGKTGGNHQFLIPLPGPGGHAIHMLAKSPLSKDQERELISHIKNGLQRGNSVAFPAELLAEFKISPDSVKLVNSQKDIAFLPFLPPNGLECLTRFYKESYEKDLVKIINDITK